MLEATLIYPHQLFTINPALARGRMVFLIEEPLFLSEFPTHTQKLLLHRLSMQSYKTHLENDGYTVTYLSISSLENTEAVFTTIKKAGYSKLHVIDTTDFWLEKRLNEATKNHNFTLIRYESPLFILEKNEAVSLYENSKKFMATFYKKLRTQTKILLEEDDTPVGGKWSFDAENQRKLPKGISLPSDIQYLDNREITEAILWLDTFSSERYGEAKVWIPYSRLDALKYLQGFISNRLEQFGAYEDALTSSHGRLFHSTLSPLINIGLLSPREVIDTAINYADKNNTSLASLEGFIRQILGWREFIRAAYECDGVTMRTKNFWGNKRPLHKNFWTGNTGIFPIDTALKNTLRYGYNHHIERLMVLGNFMLLTRTDPTEVYKWFMSMYVDAYDWVMVPNVYGMSQFADGGIFATKPYISGSNYLRKMSDYQAGEWEGIWTSLYWQFISDHADFFNKNHRLSMMPKLLAKMGLEKRQSYKDIAEKYLSA